LSKIDGIIFFARNHCCSNLEIIFETKCENCHYSLNEIVIANQVVENKRKELDKAKSEIKDYPSDTTTNYTPKEIKVKISKKILKVFEYREMLQNKINETYNYNDNDNIIIELREEE